MQRPTGKHSVEREPKIEISIGPLGMEERKEELEKPEVSMTPGEHNLQNQLRKAHKHTETETANHKWLVEN